MTTAGRRQLATLPCGLLTQFSCSTRVDLQAKLASIFGSTGRCGLLCEDGAWED